MSFKDLQDPGPDFSGEEKKEENAQVLGLPAVRQFCPAPWKKRNPRPKSRI
ncbi:hypothetical protein ACFVS2_12220 [Brevibacillus sp. NPDC058079]|uniref:hypothetical protein n=1 Tax=Brevibacillus sp. NPDC058079 TaxID=3346330 RepID=UPI0036EE750E